MQRWEKLGERVVYERFRRIVSKTFRLPDGSVEDFEIKDDLDVAAVLALTPEREFVLVREFRPGPEEVLVEIPSGLIRAGEPPVDAAARELLEETGYAGELEAVAVLFSDSYSPRTTHVFVARECRRAGEPDPRAYSEPVLLSLGDLRDHLRRGRLCRVDVGYRALDHLNLL